MTFNSKQLATFIGSMSRFENRFKFESHHVLFSAFLALSCVFALVSQYDFSISDFSGNHIGRATLDDFNIGSRVRLFYISGGILIASFFFFNYGLNYLRKLIKRELTDPSILTFLSVFGIVLLAASLFKIKIENSLNVLTSLFVLVFLFSAFGRLKFSNENNEAEIRNSILQSLLISLSLPFFFKDAFTLILGRPVRLFYNEWIIYSSVLFIICWYLINRGKKEVGSKITLLLSSLGITSFLSREILMILKLRFDLSLNHGFIYISLLIIAGIVVFFLFSQRIEKMKKNDVLFSSALLYLSGMTLLAFHNYIIEQPNEMFELANPVLSLERFFNWREWPILQAFNSHLIFEIFFGFIYALFNGYVGLEFLTYNSLHFLIQYIVLYYFLSSLLKSKMLTLILLLLFPVIPAVFHVTFTICLIFPFLIKRYSDNPGSLNFFLLTSMMLFMMFWKIDFGVGALIAVPITLLILTINGIIPRNLKQWGLVSLVLVSLIVLAFPLCILLGIPLWDNFILAYHYVNSAQAHGLTNVSHAGNFIHNSQYFLFPVMVIGLLTYIVFNIKSLFEEKRFEVLSLLFLIFFYLTNFQRGLVRHGLTAGDVWLSSFVFLIIPASIFILPLSSFIQRFRIPIFLFLMFFMSAAFKYPGITGIDFFGEKAFSRFSERDTLFSEPLTLSGRIIEDTTFVKDLAELVTFFNDHLSAEQTFFDYSNSPMLYYYTHRKVPSYFNQPLLSSQDVYLQQKLIDRLKNEDVPFVIYSSFPNSWFDEQDGVQKNVRHYLIGEYIHREYEPFALVGKYSVWIQKKLNAGELLNLIALDSNWRLTFDIDRKYLLKDKADNSINTSNTTAYTNDIHRYQHLEISDSSHFDEWINDSSSEVYSANYFPDFYSLRNIFYDTKKLGRIWAEAMNIDENKSFHLESDPSKKGKHFLLPEKRDLNKPGYLVVNASLIYSESAPAVVYLWDVNDRIVASFGIDIDRKDNMDYLIRISTHPNYYFGNPVSVSVDVGDRIKLKEVKFFEE